MRIFLAAGGTGGHIIPAIAVADALKARGAEVRFLGVGKELEQKLIGAAGYPLSVFSFPAISGKGVSGALQALLKLPLSLGKAIAFFRQEKPGALLAFGGYPSFIPICAAFCLGIPRAIHEQNAKVGLANRFLSLLSNRVFAVPGAEGFYSQTRPRVETVPNPVRSVFYDCPDWRAPQANEAFRILIVGGSQGARRVSEAFITALDSLASIKLQVVHQTGTADFERIRDIYQQQGKSFAKAIPFIDGVAAEYAASHLVISRAGAMSVAEVMASGRPAIFIPLAIARAHQSDNIRLPLAEGACYMLEQTKSLPSELAELLLKLTSRPEELMKTAALAKQFSKHGGKTSAEFLADEMLALATTKS